MAIDINDHFPLRENRVHEVSGASAFDFALALAGQLRGSVLWVREAWLSNQINPAGVGRYFDPHNLLVAKGKDQTEVLATAEESLRSGVIPLTVLELTKPLGLTEGRRLQLAAKTGKTLGLCIVSDGMGSNAAETRWQCQPIFDATDSTLQHWEIIKNKTGTLTGWNVRWNDQARRISMVSQTGE